ncbi:slc44a5a [Symbiodinium sp. CCMP2456]|nr:slc44a5a [Symbiodinium sp. CCMP2456]
MFYSCFLYLAAAMARRVERLMLSTPLVPRSLAKIRVVCFQENKVATDWMGRFLPMLRFASPDLGFDFERLKLRRQPDEDSAAEAAEAAEDTSQEVSAESPEPQAPEPEAERKELSVSEAEARECVEVQFADGSSQRLNLQLYVSSHQLMQRILDIDADKAANA